MINDVIFIINKRMIQALKKEKEDDDNNKNKFSASYEH